MYDQAPVTHSDRGQGGSQTVLQPKSGEHSHSMTEQARRFSSPWRLIELEEAFRVEDAISLPLAYVYFSDDPERRSITGYLSHEEAQRIAVNIAALPDLRAALREKDTVN